MKTKLITAALLTITIHGAVSAKAHTYTRVVTDNERQMYMAGALVHDQVLSLYCDQRNIAFSAGQHGTTQVSACFVRYPYGEKLSLDSGIITNGEYAVRIAHDRAGHRDNAAFPMAALNRESNEQLRNLKEWAQVGGDISVVRYWGDAPHDKRPTITRW